MYPLNDWCTKEDPRECPSGDQILQQCILVADMLLGKNRKYGDSALNPMRVFSKANAEEQIRVRLDDKLSRLKSQQDDEDEDVERDILGYLVLARIARKRREAMS